MIVRDSIDDYFARPKTFGNKPKDEVEVIIRWAHSRCPLDYTTDEPVPQWVMNILKLSRLPYRARVKIMEWHANKILTYRRVKEARLKKKFKEDQAATKALAARRAAEQGIEEIDLDNLRGLVF